MSTIDNLSSDKTIDTIEAMVRDSDIAIIGSACRVPGAENPQQFWQNLRHGVESTTFFSDAELEENNRALPNNPNYVKAGSILSDIAGFDADFFAYSPNEAAMLDPQQRILLECAWEALEAAGYAPDAYPGSVGVYAGSGMSHYFLNQVHSGEAFTEVNLRQFQAYLANDRNFLPTRISYKLNLTGPSVNIQTACSTGLVVVHQACQSLLLGECDLALAGTVSLRVPQKRGYLYQEGMVRSPDGHCRAFDAAAEGTLFGNGAGMVVLKRAHEAVEAGDPILAIIKGSAINNDGADKVSFTAPSIAKQAAAIADALLVAEIDPVTISYVEAHGTGTRLGDPAEILALTQAFERLRGADILPNQFCAIGSVKTNIGHLDEAAGMAGLIKTVLALKHKQIPPSLHFKQPNPQIDFENSPFYVKTELSEWTTNGYPRRAGVSSFGMGGTNSHVVLEEAPVINHSPSVFERDRHLLALSAKTPQALEQLVLRYVDYLVSDAAQEAGLANICFTANTGRKHFSHRAAFVVESKAELREQLEEYATYHPHKQEARAQTRKIAFLFTGQGSQYVNMGRQLYESQPIFRQTIDRCDEILRDPSFGSGRRLLRSLRSVLYPEKGQPSPINETAYTQPALFAVEYALYELWKSWGIEPDVVMGHSVGEIVAACVAGVFTLEDGLKLIAERGRLMQALPADGSMVSVMASEAHVAALILPYEGQVSIAAINTSPAKPGGSQSVVISGQTEAIDAICSTLNAQGVKIKRLQVSHAFHSPLMRPMLASFSEVAQQVSYSEPLIKLISNVTGQPVNHDVTSAAYWVRHIQQPVRFAQGCKSLERLGANVFIEIGPKPVLLGMARECLPEQDALWLPSLRLDQDWQQILSSLRALYLHNYAIDWVATEFGYTRRRLSLPTYPFQRERYWLEGTTPTRKQVAYLTPLIDKLIQLPRQKQIVCETNFSVERLPFLADHIVFGEIVSPGACQLAMTLTAAHLAYPQQAIQLVDVALPQALVLESESERTVQVVFSSDSSSKNKTPITFELISFIANVNVGAAEEADATWQTHASGGLAFRRSAQVPSVDKHQLQTRCSRVVDLDAFHALAAAQQIQFGPSFRWLTEIWCGEGEAFARLEQPEAIGKRHEYKLHPALLDACLQVTSALTVSEEGAHDHSDTYLPFALESLTLFGEIPKGHAVTGEPLWCHTQRARCAQRHDSQRWHIQLLDDAGRVLLQIEGYTERVASPQLVLGREAWREWLVQVQWQPQATFGHLPSYLPNSTTLSQVVDQECEQNLNFSPVEEQVVAWRQLDALCVDYILAAFAKAGIRFEAGTEWQRTQLARQLGVIPAYRRLLERLLQILGEAGVLRPVGNKWQVRRTPSLRSPREQVQRLQSQFGVLLEAELNLLVHCAKDLNAVMRGMQDPLELLFPGGDSTLVNRTYQNSPIADAMNRMVQEAVKHALAQLPAGQGVRILEIGAGTGGTTAGILPLLLGHANMASNQIDYLFTDIGAGFLLTAQEKFADYPFVRYQKLNIEQSPAEQGIDLYQYDIVIAANVLHATRDLSTTLAHVQQLLLPGGLLILLEDTRPSGWVDLTFGLTDGWWRFDDQRQRHPLMSVAEWEQLLLDCGFQTAIRATKRDLGQNVLLAHMSATDIERVHTGRTWLLLADQSGMGEALAAQLGQRGEQPILIYAGDAWKQAEARSKDGVRLQTFTIRPDEPTDYEKLLTIIPDIHGVVQLWGLDTPTEPSPDALQDALRHICTTSLHIVQALLHHGAVKHLCLVMRDTQAVLPDDRSDGVVQAALWGLGRTIALEHPELGCICIDIDRHSLSNDSIALANQAANLCAELLASSATSTPSAQGTRDRQLAWRQGMRYVARLDSAQPLRGESDSAELTVPSDPFHLESMGLGHLDQLHFVPITRPELAADEVTIRVRATGLNFRDVLIALNLYPDQDGTLGGECAGEVVAVGDGVTRFAVGQPVIALVDNGFGNYVTTNQSLVMHKPAELSYEAAATLPITYLTAYYALHHLAHIQAGDRVLIHAASGGVGQAAMQLARAAGAEVYATASRRKWDRLRAMGVEHIYNSRTLGFGEQIQSETNGRGVDIVLNSLTSEGFIAQSLSTLAPQGRFIEIAKRDVWSPQQMAANRPDVQYHLIDLGDPITQSPQLVQQWFSAIVEQCAEGILQPLPYTTFPIEQVISAFRTMQQAKHIGKIVVTQKDQHEWKIRPDRTYLLTGGWGGLGLQVASWLVEQGAQQLLLLGRSQPTPTAQQQIQKLEALGAVITMQQVDVSQREQVAQALAQIPADVPLGGIIHGAGTLNDGALLLQNWDSFEKVLGPKVYGAWHLHTLTQESPLDFFVLFSSTTGLLGNKGQANHAAANVFLDTLAHYRQARDLPGLSISWGTWSEIGAAAAMVQRNKSKMAERGEGVIDPIQGIQSFAYLLQQNQPHVGVMPTNWEKFLATEQAKTAFFAHFDHKHRTALPIEQEKIAMPVSFRTQLSQADTRSGQRRTMLIKHLQGITAKILGRTKPEQLNVQARLIDLGMDSLMAIELRNVLARSIEERLPATLFFTYPTLDALTDHLMDVLAEPDKPIETLDLDLDNEAILPIDEDSSLEEGAEEWENALLEQILSEDMDMAMALGEEWQQLSALLDS